MASILTESNPTQSRKSILISATYDGKLRKAVLKFYDIEKEQIYNWYDNKGHKPYCLVRSENLSDDVKRELLDRKDITTIQKIKKMDLRRDKQVTLEKIIATDPLAIGGSNENSESIRNKIKPAWEANIKYYENYLYDMGLIPGSFYYVNDSEIVPIKYDLPVNAEKIREKTFEKSESDRKKRIIEWAQLLSQPLPPIKRVALDIEVVAPERDRLPDPDQGKYQVIAVSLVGSDGLKEVYLLKRENVQLGSKTTDSEVKMHLIDDERELMTRLFDKICEYPCVITFNGDDFDLKYLYNRAKNHLGFSKEEIPISLPWGVSKPAGIKHGIHIDLYKTFMNRALQIYVFGNKYVEHSLNGVSTGLLGESKVKVDGFLGDLPLHELGRYCYQDALLTYKLTSLDNDLLMKLFLVIARISKMPIDDVSRIAVSGWIRSMMYFEHRKMNALIPRKEELEKTGSSSSTASIKGKKYKGGMVVEPKTGIHFNVAVLDFSSLYPSIIKVWNLSYETVNCIHNDDKRNMIKGTDYWLCTKRDGISSLVIGSLRDIRVDYYKQLARLPGSESEKNLYNVVSQALKVILNASYGVMGAELFPLYCLPVADATAAIGRNVIVETIEQAKNIGIEVVYGDTDSLFMKAPKQHQINEITRWASDNLGVELDLEKVYRYVAFSSRKKNYLGVKSDGSVDIKGLTGKKSHVPPFIKDAFYDAVSTLSKVKTPDDFEEAREEIKKDIRKRLKHLKNGDVPLDQLAFRVMMSKSIERYDKRKPQHVRAAILLRERTRKEIGAGNIITYIKIIGGDGVMPLELAKKREIDKKKYEEMMQSTFDQLLDSLGYSFDEILGATKLEDLFWGN